jgi:hypothetical protein
LLAIGALAILAIACGTDESSSDSAAGSSGGVGSASEKIIVSDRIYTADDLKTAGFKKSKTYDVAELEGAVSAIYGFYGVDPYNRQEYEVRFYANHEDALAFGTSYADEATGGEAVILESVQRWKVGLTERRQCAGNGGHHSGKCDNPKYGDYMIVGNMILMCQGKTSGDSIDTCQALLSQIS